MRWGHTSVKKGGEPTDNFYLASHRAWGYSNSTLTNNGAGVEHSRMFTAPLNWKQPRCPSTEECMNTLRSIT